MQAIQAQETRAGQLTQNHLTFRPMSSFADYLTGHPICEPLMPVVHTTKYLKFVNILNSHQLLPMPCSRFKKDLLYLFYGRPAYRVSVDVTADGQLLHLPISFILQPDVVSTSEGVYPFDTGAYFTDRYKAFLDGIALDGFELGDFPVAPQKLVSAFYRKGNADYYSGNVVDKIEASELDIEVNAYFRLIKDTEMAYRDETSPDDRRLTAEILSKDWIDLRANQLPDGVVQNRVLAVAVPLQAVPKVEEVVTKTWGAELLTYRASLFSKPDECHGMVWQRVTDFLERKGFL
jgi:hypothetical protein